MADMMCAQVSSAVDTGSLGVSATAMPRQEMAMAATGTPRLFSRPNTEGA